MYNINRYTIFGTCNFAAVMSGTELDPSGTSDGPKSDEGIKQKQVLNRIEPAKAGQ